MEALEVSNINSLRFFTTGIFDNLIYSYDNYGKRIGILVLKTERSEIFLETKNFLELKGLKKGDYIKAVFRISQEGFETKLVLDRIMKEGKGESSGDI